MRIRVLSQGRAVLGGTICLICAAAFAQQEVITVSNCPSEMLPVTFQVDCSNVANPEAKEACKPFAYNQACKVFFAYRRITGINLEEGCPTFKYALYDKDKWPHQGGDAGGYAGRCGAELLTDSLIRSKIGPYDVHEILHVYQDSALGALPDAHILFGPAMAEAQREIGDGQGNWNAMSRMKAGFNRGDDPHNRELPPERQCVLAEFHIEDSLYVQNPKNVELFYRKLERGRAKEMADRQARFNRMFDAVSGGAARAYLLAHGCAPF